MLSIEVANCQDAMKLDARRLRRAAEAVLRDAEMANVELSIAIVDDAEIHRLNRQFLSHDYPTDVLSFVLEREGDRLHGEIVASAETAVRSAQSWGWSADDELLLYVIHGALHLVGYDDSTDSQRKAMREAERKYLAQLDAHPPASPDGDGRQQSRR